MALTDHVQLTITLDSVGIARAGFGVPMILSHNASFPDRIRYYNSYADVVTDGFEGDSPEALAAAAFFGQSPRPPTIGIGRATASVTQQYTVGASAIRDSEEYSITVGGEGFEDDDATYTSDSTASASEIHNGLVTALNAVTDKTYTATFAPLVYADKVFTADNTTEIFTAAAHTLQTGDGPFQVSNSGGALPAGLVALTDYWVIRIDANTFYLATSLANALAGTFLSITTNGTGTQTLSDTVNTKRPFDPFLVTGDTAGAWFSLEVYDVNAMSIKQTHTVSDIDDDLTDILLADGGWYEVHTLYNSNDYVKDVAAWVEANKRLYVFDVNETDSITTTYTATVSTDTLAQLMDLGYARTMGAYHPRPSAQFAAAWMGRWLPTDPGKATAKYKTLAGVEAVVLSATHRNNLVARRSNSYQGVAGRNITWEGTVFSTTYKFLDVVRNLDWVEDDLLKGIFGALAGADIVPYTPEGIAMIEAQVRATMTRAVAKGIFSKTPVPVVTAPEFEDIDDTDKEDRTLRDVKFEAKLAGAIHKVLTVGSVTF